MSKQAKGYLMLLLAAMIWGCAFVAQSVGMDYVGPFTFQAVRCLLGAVTLVPVLLLRRPAAEGSKKVPLKTQLLSGVVCGVVLFSAISLQQFGICYTTVGKSGFISALYIIIVPILGLFLHKKVRPVIWLCLLFACLGLYLLSMEGGFGSISLGDVLTLGCAVCFAVHILVIAHFSLLVDGVVMSFLQFLVSSFLSAVCMLIWETPTLSAVRDCWLPLCYTGILSSGVAYTLQILAQKSTKPTIATLLMSLESVFAAVFGWILLREALNLRQLAGCAIMFTATILALLPDKKVSSSRA